MRRPGPGPWPPRARPAETRRDREAADGVMMAAPAGYASSRPVLAGEDDVCAGAVRDDLDDVVAGGLQVAADGEVQGGRVGEVQGDAGVVAAPDEAGGGRAGAGADDAGGAGRAAGAGAARQDDVAGGGPA